MTNKNIDEVLAWVYNDAIDGKPFAAVSSETRPAILEVVLSSLPEKIAVKPTNHSELLIEGAFNKALDQCTSNIKELFE